MRNLALKKFVFIAALALAAGCSEKSDSRAQTAPPNPKRAAALAQAKELTETAYNFKLTGQNGAALRLFEQAGSILKRVGGDTHYEVASNLDDQATVHLRTGQFDKARNLYLKAKDLLKQTGLEQGRLDQSIDRRLFTLDNFEKNRIPCSEPLETAVAPNPAGPPYFPASETMEPVFHNLAKELGVCVAEQKLPVPVRMVITGSGRIVEAHVKGLYHQTREGRCIEKRILELAPKYAAALPRFSACYKNVTYPFPIGQ